MAQSDEEQGEILEPSEEESPEPVAEEKQETVQAASQDDDIDSFFG